MLRVLGSNQEVTMVGKDFRSYILLARAIIVTAVLLASIILAATTGWRVIMVILVVVLGVGAALAWASCILLRRSQPKVTKVPD